MKASGRGLAEEMTTRRDYYARYCHCVRRRCGENASCDGREDCRGLCSWGNYTSSSILMRPIRLSSSGATQTFPSVI